MGAVFARLGQLALDFLPVGQFDSRRNHTGERRPLVFAALAPRCCGGYAPVYIAEKVSGNRFKIAGGR